MSALETFMLAIHNDIEIAHGLIEDLSDDGKAMDNLLENERCMETMTRHTESLVNIIQLLIKRGAVSEKEVNKLVRNIQAAKILTE